jgi:hypothetical protein
VIWLISMNIFHSPANSMLEMFASAKSLPSAMALMVLTTELLYSLEPLIVAFVDFIGPVLTFALGGVLLIVTGYFFRRTTRNLNLVRASDSSRRSDSNFVLVLAAGLALGLAAALIKNYLPEKINLSFVNAGSDVGMTSSLIISLVLATAAVAAWPLSKLVDKIGTEKSLIYGLIGTFACISVISFVSNAFILIVFGFVAAPFFSLASVAAFPFALSKLSLKSVTLGTGVFFGSTEIADGIMNIFATL